jgi:hypothetical protein
LYSYVGNNPINRIDPNGRFFKELFNFVRGRGWNDGTEVTTDVSFKGIESDEAIAESMRDQVVDNFSTIKLPEVRSGGEFLYGGIGAKSKKLGVSGECLVLLQYDSEEGGSHSSLWAGGLGPFSGGVEVTRTWKDWEEKVTPIGLGEHEIPSSSKIFGKKVVISSWDIGGFVDYDSEQKEFSLGGFAGFTLGSGRSFGGGGYSTWGW